MRLQIETIKTYIKNTKKGFDGDGYVFKKALKELRTEGLKIIYSKKDFMYYKI